MSRIFAQCLDASGARQWPDTGLVVSDAPGEQVTPALVAGDAGTVIVAWMNATGSGERPYAQALDAGGQRLWGANGVAAGGEIPSSSGAVAGAAANTGESSGESTATEASAISTTTRSRPARRMLIPVEKAATRPADA